jgi:hypothetical protein
VTTPTGLPRGKPFQSKLEPVRQLIRELRRARKSYREIADILRVEHGIAADRTTIWSFVKVRAHPRRVITMADEPFDPMKSSAAANADGAIAALKVKPVNAREKPLFTFNEDLPLTLKTNP